MSLPPLAGIRILDMTRLVPGLAACSILGDLGADVVKIERPGKGDDLRRIPPLDEDGNGIYFKAMARNIRSLALDTVSEEGRKVLVELVKKADVFIHSFRPGVMESQGLGAEHMLAVNKDLIYCSVNGYGSNGPLSNRASHDLNYQALAGTLANELPEGVEPRPPGALAADHGGALHCVISVLSALMARSRDGRGQAVEVSLYGAVLSTTGMTAAAALVLGRNYEHGEYRLSGKDPAYGVYRTADGSYMALAALEPKFWLSFLSAVDRTDLAEMRVNADSWPKLRKELEVLFSSKTRREWAAISQEGDFCLTEVLSPLEAVQHPQAIEAGLVLETGEGKKILSFPNVLSRTPKVPPVPAPSLGEQTDEVLADYGFPLEEIARMRKAKVIG